MKVLVTGGGGQLAKALADTAQDHVELSVRAMDSLDVTSKSQIEEVMANFQPEVVINTAAYTAVDAAESDQSKANSVNQIGPWLLAEAAKKHGSRLLHMSTDFVFGGTSEHPWKTTDNTNPLSVYGRTKLEGENRIQESMKNGWTIVRTAWLYDATSRNFVTNMIRLMKEREEIGVVSDQTGTPTQADSLAVAIWCMVDEGIDGMHHWTDAGTTTWHGFASAIEEICAEKGLLTRRTRVRPITTGEYPTPARRPSYSVLEKSKTWAALKGTRAMPAIHWRENLEKTISEKMDV